ncbi:hypothetical protein [Vibrio sp. SS-MA-C1-2]|uniref:hypothetical protein n=1 Tax=Vibrio sp. SS-MA-C1-2 TaxID=2908646 RepID=UPI0038FC2C7E
MFDIFNNVFNYLLQSGAKFVEGNTMQVNENTFMKLRLPTNQEYLLDSESDIFVAEFIPESEINQC